VNPFWLLPTPPPKPAAAPAIWDGQAFCIVPSAPTRPSEGILEAGPTITALELLLIVAGAVVLFLFVRVVRRGFTLLRRTRTSLAGWAPLGPMAEALLWLVYLVSVIAWTLKDYYLVRLGALAALALAAVIAVWFVIRDYLSGVVIRTEAAMARGDVVRIGDIEGQVLRFRARGVELELSHGDRVLLPYRVIRDAPLVRRRTHLAAVRRSFSVPVPPDLGIDATRETVRRAALLSHWVSPSHDPKVTAVDEATLEVTIHALTETRAVEVEQVVRAAVAAATPTSAPAQRH